MLTGIVARRQRQKPASGHLAIGLVGVRRAGAGAGVGMVAFTVERELAAVGTRIRVGAVLRIGAGLAKPGAVHRLVAIAVEGVLATVARVGGEFKCS